MTGPAKPPRTRTALIAGSGNLPAAVVAALEEPPFVAAMEGYPPHHLIPDLCFRIERLVPFLNRLTDEGVERVILAGAVTRPRLDPALFDSATAQLVPRLLPTMQAGDDATLRAILGLIEEFGFRIAGIPEVAPGLIPGEGVLSGAPTDADRSDAVRAAFIAAAIGGVDVGQACAVQQGLCLGLESLPGTDAMLRGVADIALTLRPDPAKGRGIFYKAAKPGQDRRVDMPTIGSETLHRVIDADLGAIVWEAGTVIVLDRPKLIQDAERNGILLWSRAP